MEQNSPEINPQVYGQLIFEEGVKNIQWGKYGLLTVVLGKLNIHIQKDEIGLLPLNIHKTQLKMD